MVPGFDWLDSYAYKPLEPDKIRTSLEAAECIQHVCKEHNVHCRIADTEMLVRINMQSDGNAEYVKQLYRETIADPIWNELHVQVNAPAIIQLPGKNPYRLYARIMRALPTHTHADANARQAPMHPSDGLTLADPDETINDEFNQQYTFGLIQAEIDFVRDPIAAIKNSFAADSETYNDLFSA